MIRTSKSKRGDRAGNDLDKERSEGGRSLTLTTTEMDFPGCMREQQKEREKGREKKEGGSEREREKESRRGRRILTKREGAINDRDVEA